MRIKKYENWKLAATNRPNTTCSRPEKISDIFSISQLLQTPKKTFPSQSEHHYSLTDPKAINNTFNLTRKNLNKNDIQINIFVRPFNRELRDEAIKSKIKQRIKQQFSSHQNKNDPTPYFLKQAIEEKMSSSSIQQTKNQPNQGRVYVRGNSVALSSADKRKRSKSSFLRTSLPNFSQKNKLVQLEGFKKMDTQTQQKLQLTLVDMKRRLSSSLAARQKKTVSTVNKKNSLKEIDPWQIDEGPQIFEL